MDFQTSASGITLGSTNMRIEIAPSTLLHTSEIQYVRLKSGIRVTINYGGLTPQNFFLVTFATQPAPVPNEYSTALTDTALSTITGRFLLPDYEIARSQVTLISPETLDCGQIPSNHKIGI
jgi:hypothetical protein